MSNGFSPRERNGIIALAAVSIVLMALGVLSGDGCGRTPMPPAAPVSASTTEYEPQDTVQKYERSGKKQNPPTKRKKKSGRTRNKNSRKTGKESADRSKEYRSPLDVPMNREAPE